MKKRQPYFLLFYLVPVILFFFGCREEKPDNILTQLKEKGKIITYSLTIITADKLNENALQNLKPLCAFSNRGCKALADAGILRLGSNIYYPYNAISALQIDDSVKNNENAISRSVEQQVDAYFATARPKDFDSLTTDNPTFFNQKELILSHMNKTVADSVFFFAASAANGTTVFIQNRFYEVYTSPEELRNKINEVVCKGQGTISVFYNPPVSLEANSTKAVKIMYPEKGIIVGDTCIGTSRYERVQDGYGAFMAGRLLQANSPDCGAITTATPEKSKTVTNKPVIKDLPVSRKPVSAKETPLSTVKTDNRCARKSDPACETDEAGNYTGRRIQYCYNSLGKIIQTIVLSKCDTNCRCF